jgi:V8-like Glu-specific endopeptidase
MARWMAVWGAVLMLMLAQALPARADTLLHALSTLDDSKGWEGVGRLNLGDRGFCTASLIAPDVVLTAAHCLYDETTGARFPLTMFRFLADWRLGRAAAYRGVKRAVIAPGYDFGSADKIGRIGHDIALLQLDQPIRLPAIRPFTVSGRAQMGEAVGVVSYARDRSDAPSLQQTCRVLDTQPGLLVLTCDIDFGSSGAPIFQMRNGAATIVSVISAKAEADGQQVALGVDLPAVIGALQAHLVAEENGTILQAIPTQTGANGTPSAPVMPTGGAKFLRATPP